MSIELDAFLEHHGIKGQRWGVRRDKALAVSKSIGRGTATTAKAIGRGSKATFNWTKDHKKIAVTIGAGVIAVGLILKGKHSLKLRDIKIQKQRSNFEASKRIFDAQKNIRMHDLGRIASNSGPGSVTREMAFKEMNDVVKNYNNKLREIALENGVNQKSLWELK